MDILITSANSAAAYKLKGGLTAYKNILLGDYNDLPEFMVSSGKMIKLPNPKSVSYPHQMLALCLDNVIGVVYVLDKEEANQLKESDLLFAEYGIELKFVSEEI